MQRIELTPGMRVRCVRSASTRNLNAGENYTIVDRWSDGGINWVKVREISGGWLAERFKPIVRVKALTS